MMEWTTEKPSKPGWYWNRLEKSSAECLVQVGNRENPFAMKGLWVLSHPSRYFTVDEYGGEWSSEPIPEPKEKS